MAQLSPVAEKFILHWGELGTRWGINRTVAQIYALLFVSPKPLHAEDIAETLSVARSNVSTSLRELQGWGIVRVVHVLGDRKDHYECMKDVWEMIRTIVRERKHREVDPIVATLKDCVAQAEQTKEDDPEAVQNLKNLLDVFSTLEACYEQLDRMPTTALVRFARLGDRMSGLFNLLS